MKLIHNLDKKYSTLLECAIKARNKAKADYSKYRVGAALLDSYGNIHLGCNVESADYTLTTHAEMLAVDNFILNGNGNIEVILIVLEGKNKPATPCGLCRQKLNEFASKDLKIICVNLNNKEKINSIYEFTLEELLPYSFDSSFLNLE